MGSVEQDLRRHEREQDEAIAADEAAERAAIELDAEISQCTDDLENLLFEAVEHGDFPFDVLARMLTIQSRTTDAQEFIHRLRAAIEPRKKALIAKRTPERLSEWQSEAEVARVQAQIDDLTFGDY